MNRTPESDAEPRAIEMASLCKTLHTLPRAGGLYDQDWYHVALLKAGLYAIGKKEQRDQKEQEAQIKRH
jgi:hypothetical protein